MALRQQIAHYLFNSRGVTCHPNQIIIGSSTEQLLDMITDVLSDSSFIIEQPSYPPIKQTLDKKQMPYKQVIVEKMASKSIPSLNTIMIFCILPLHINFQRGIS